MKTEKKKSWFPVYFMRPTLLAYKSSQGYYKKGPLQTNIAQEPLPASVSLSVQWASRGTKGDRVSRGRGVQPDCSSRAGGPCGGGGPSESLQPGLRPGVQRLSSQPSPASSSRGRVLKPPHQAGCLARTSAAVIICELLYSQGMESAFNHFTGVGIHIHIEK